LLGRALNIPLHSIEKAPPFHQFHLIPPTQYRQTKILLFPRITIRDLNSRSERHFSGNKLEAALGTQPNVYHGETNSWQALPRSGSSLPLFRLWEANYLISSFFFDPRKRPLLRVHLRHFVVQVALGIAAPSL
jgi:hypothetical protein